MVRTTRVGAVVLVASAASWMGCAPREAAPVTAETTTHAPPALGGGGERRAERGLRTALVKFEGTAQVDCKVSDGSGKTLLEGTSFFDESNRGGIEIDHRDAGAVRRLRVSRMPDAREGGMVLELMYEEHRKEDNAQLEFRPVLRVVPKGTSEVSVKLASGEERRFMISTR